MSQPSQSTHSTVQQSRTRRVRADASRRAQQHLEREKAENQIRVLDPDNKSIDRTPQPVLKAATQGGKSFGRGDKLDPDTSVSQSQRSQSEGDRSVSQLESSQSTETGALSTGTPDDDDSRFMEESSMESTSTDRTNLERRRSALSSVAETATEARQTTEARQPGQSSTDQPVKQPEKKKEMTQDEKRQWLQQDVAITLTETPTIFLFERGDEAISRETDEADAVKKKNERYEAFCEARKGGESGGRYLERGMTTLNNPRKTAESEVHYPSVKNSGAAQVTTWKLYDEFLKLNEEEVEQEDAGVGTVKQEAEETQNEDENAQQDEGEAGEAEGGEGGAAVGTASAKKSNLWMQSANVVEMVMFVERVVVSNVFEELQLAYRGEAMEMLKDNTPNNDGAKVSAKEEERDQDGRRRSVGFAEEQQGRAEDVPKYGFGSQKTKLKTLWRYGCEVTRNKNVSCQAWNHKNPDILAAGYGEYGIPGATQSNGRNYSGFICCWSLKNPLYPERVIQMESEAGVSAMHFSINHPSLLAVGNTDGTLALYDVRKHGNAPALKTSVGTGQHTGTIWEVRWVEKGKDRGENLVSISADGTVMEWSIKKGLERTAELMKLKRVTKSENRSAYSKGERKEALLARQSGGMCFDFNPRERITYVVGTEDGTVHKCSKSQNEHFILDYKSHEEPVYRIRFNPFCPDYFLTCSADWTSRLYDIDKPEPVVKFEPPRQDAVHDVCWSPTLGTIFGAATAQGHVEIWDVADPMGPKASLHLEGRSLNTLLFGEQESPVITVGDNRGDVTVLKLDGPEFERRGMKEKEQEERFQECVHKITG